MKPIFGVNRKVILFGGLVLASFFLLAALQFLLANPVSVGNAFKYQKLSLNSYDLHDLGVVDVNHDQKLDIYTSNHSALQSLAINQGYPDFVESLSEYGLSQDRQTPGLEVSNHRKRLNDPGLYLYRTNRFRWSTQASDNVLVLAAHKTGPEMTNLKGKITLDSAVKVNQNKNFTAQIEKHTFPDGRTRSEIDFTVPSEGKLVLETNLTALPTDVHLNEEIPLASVHLGQFNHHPTAHNFKMHWRDRHGIAWADYNSDEHMDAFITRGGLKGKLDQVSETTDRDFFNDELFPAVGKTTETVAKESGLLKNNCPGRQTAWTDFNQDQKLDIYVVCGRGVPPLGNSPNQLYRQGDNSKFTDVAAETGIDFPEQGVFAWTDTNGDRTVDFIWATKEAFQIFHNQNGQLTLDQEIENKIGQIKKLSITDFDLDGDPDIFVTRARASLLLVNENNRFVETSPDAIGLPNKALTANWVDYDNDGLIDLHAVPDGLFHQTENHRFERTHLLEHNPRLSKLVSARCTWFDADNDGFRDLLIGMSYRPWWLRVVGALPRLEIPEPRDADVALYRNTLSNDNHWLQVALQSDLGNSPAIGSNVSLQNPYGDQSLNIGHAEGARFSQGHYRLYFGLGKQKSAGTIRVTWPNGQVEAIDYSGSDELVSIKQTKS